MPAGVGTIHALSFWFRTMERHYGKIFLELRTKVEDVNVHGKYPSSNLTRPGWEENTLLRIEGISPLSLPSKFFYFHCTAIEWGALARSLLLLNLI